MIRFRSHFGRLDLYMLFFILGVAVLCFLLGGMLGIKKHQPFVFISKQISLAKEATTQLLDQRPILLRRKRHDHVGVRVRGANFDLKGYFLLQGWFSDGAQVRMIDHSGTVHHQWFVDFFNIWPNPKHIKPASRVPNSRFNFHTQGFVAEPDGTLIVAVGNHGATKLDKCSKVLWTVDTTAHHVITADEQGGYWIAANRDFDEVPDEFLFGNVTRDEIASSVSASYENLLIQIDNGGNILRELSILKSLFATDYEHRILDALYFDRTDLTHINDIEVVSRTLADRIQDVNEGDLLVSIRQMHMIAIIDSATGELKWSQTGPWVRQHDPDIMPNGNIRVFNNGGSREFQVSINRIAGSNIIEFDPVAREWEILLPTKPEFAFFTDEMGSYQAMPNGHHLIAESRAGRVLQFSETKELVWEYIAEYNEEYAALIEIAQWVPDDYFDTLEWDCPDRT